MAIIVMADPDYPHTPEHDVYWKALGRFIHRYAMLEQQIAYLLSLYAKVPRPTAQALFSGIRAKDAFSMIERLREVRGDAEDQDLSRAKQQWGQITKLRNDIVHYGATLHEDGFKVENTRTIPRLQTQTPVSATQLDAMTDDVQTIAATIFAHQIVENGMRLDQYATDWAQVGRAPWKYKPGE